MTNAQVDHLNSLLQRHNKMMTEKFTAGTVKHSGDLRDQGLLELLDNALAENIDQFTYLLTLRDKLVESGIPKTHTPGRKIKQGEQDIECYFCWNKDQRIKCIESRAT